MLEPMLPAFPQNEEQMQVTVEQWDADLAHDTVDRLAGTDSRPTHLSYQRDLADVQPHRAGPPRPDRVPHRQQRDDHHTEGLTHASR